MTTKVVGFVEHFIGQAADVKPAGVWPGAQFLAYDTGAVYVTYDGTNWVQINTIIGSAQLPTALATHGGLKVEGVISGTRNGGVLHRSAIAAVDKLIDLANTDLATADNGVGTGSLANGTTYYVTAIAYNRWGTGKVASVINTQAMGAGAATHSCRLTIPQVAGADGYNLFLSTDAAPKWVAVVTEAQRAAGDYKVTAVGTVAAGGGNPAGTVDILVVGTQTVTSHAIFAQSNAYTPGAAGITAINCVGYSKAHVKVKYTATDLRVAPALTIVPFFGNQVSATDWHQGVAEVMSLLNDLGQSLERELVLNVDGETALKVLVGSLTGTNAACSIWIELA